MMPLRITVVATALALGTGCATAPQAYSSYDSPARSHPAMQSADLLTAREFSQTSATDLYEAIRILRPSLLHPRGGDVTVAVDGMLIGGVSSLRTVPLMSVATVNLLNGPDATFQFGRRTSGAVLLVTTRR